MTGILWSEAARGLCDNIYRFHLDYGGRTFSGVEFVGDDEKSGQLKTYVFSNQNADQLEYTWEIDKDTFTNWFGDVGASKRYKGKFSEDQNGLIGDPNSIEHHRFRV